MRLALLFCLAALPLRAEVIVAPSEIERVTVFPYGAGVERRIAFDVAAGSHTLLIPGLPEYLDAQYIFVTGTSGVTVGAISLAADRPPATGDTTLPAIREAEAEVERLEDVVRRRETAVAGIRARAEAAEARIAFLAALGKGEGLPADAAQLQAIARMVADETLAARQAALDAGAEAAAADRAIRDDREALDEARKALAALTAGEAQGDVLTLSVLAETDGPAEVRITTYQDAATWTPVYDMHLTQGETPTLGVDRGLVVQQDTGEDWRNVELVFSTASPGDQIGPTAIWPVQRSIVAEGGSDGYFSSSSDYGGSPVVVEPEVMLEEASTSSALTELVGTTVVYRYPHRVDLRSGSDAVRLALDTVALAPELTAVAAPLTDRTAFLVATVTNGTGELLLPGDAMLWRDGALVGVTSFDLLAAGDEAEIGFGPIHGITLERTIPERSEGDRGVISRSTGLTETAVITIRNLTGQSWPVRVIDRVPYSEQDDLVIRYQATPTENEADIDGKRGVLVWNMQIEPGSQRRIELKTTMTWPSGYVLQ